MKRRRIWLWLALGVSIPILYLAFLLAFAPADYLAAGVSYFSQGAIAFEQPTGTLWAGRASLVRAPAPALGQIEWDIHPWRLLTGSFVSDWRFAGSDIEARATVDLGWRRHELRDVSVDAPAKTAMLIYPAATVLGLGGRLRLTTAAIEVRPDALQGSAELLWQGATSRLLSIPTAGDYKLDIDARGKRADLRVSTLQGVLQVAAEGEWRALEDGTLRLQGTVAAVPPQPALDPLLNAIGPPQADGRRSFNVEPRLKPIDAAKLFP